MYCSSCGSPNGDFAVRCHACGQLLPGQPRVPPATQAPASPRVNSVLAGTTIAMTICLIGLAALITQRGLWPRLFSPLPRTATGVAESRATATLRQRAVPMPTVSVIPRPVHPTMLDLGQVGSSASWRFVVNDVSFAPDESANGWYRAVITYTLLNTSDRAAALPIPSTVPNESSNQRTTTKQPSFLPMPSIPEEDPSVANGLRLYLLDRGGRAFGGGFGTSGGGYEFIAASGDAIRLGYRFRYPANSTQPFAVRFEFPPKAGAARFDVNLNQKTSSPASLVPSTITPRAPEGTNVKIGTEWLVTCEGVDFSPAQQSGERPVTVHLRVENLTDTARPALTDSADASGSLRDFYLTDALGHLAYSHSDNLPGVVVPAHETRSVLVHLYTLDLSSAAHPLYFSAVVNWLADRAGQFVLQGPNPAN